MRKQTTVAAKTPSKPKIYNELLEKQLLDFYNQKAADLRATGMRTTRDRYHKDEHLQNSTKKPSPEICMLELGALVLYTRVLNQVDISHALVLDAQEKSALAAMQAKFPAHGLTEETLFDFIKTGDTLLATLYKGALADCQRLQPHLAKVSDLTSASILVTIDGSSATLIPTDLSSSQHVKRALQTAKYKNGIDYLEDTSSEATLYVLFDTKKAVDNELLIHDDKEGSYSWNIKNASASASAPVPPAPVNDIKAPAAPVTKTPSVLVTMENGILAIEVLEPATDNRLVEAQLESAKLVMDTDYVFQQPNQFTLLDTGIQKAITYGLIKVIQLPATGITAAAAAGAPGKKEYEWTNKIVEQKHTAHKEDKHAAPAPVGAAGPQPQSLAAPAVAGAPIPAPTAGINPPPDAKVADKKIAAAAAVTAPKPAAARTQPVDAKQKEAGLQFFAAAIDNKSNVAAAAPTPTAAGSAPVPGTTKAPTPMETAGGHLHPAGVAAAAAAAAPAAPAPQPAEKQKEATQPAPASDNKGATGKPASTPDVNPKSAHTRKYTPASTGLYNLFTNAPGSDASAAGATSIARVNAVKHDDITNTLNDIAGDQDAVTVAQEGIAFVTVTVKKQFIAKVEPKLSAAKYGSKEENANEVIFKKILLRALLKELELDVLPSNTNDSVSLNTHDELTSFSSVLGFGTGANK